MHARTRACEDAWHTRSCAHANIPDPDTDDSLYPFANQLYMSRRRESEEVQQLLVCKQSRRVIVFLLSLTPFNPQDTTKFSNFDPLSEQRRFYSFLLIFSLLCATCRICTQLCSSPVPPPLAFLLLSLHMLMRGIPRI